MTLIPANLKSLSALKDEENAVSKRADQQSTPKRFSCASHSATAPREDSYDVRRGRRGVLKEHIGRLRELEDKRRGWKSMHVDVTNE